MFRVDTTTVRPQPEAELMAEAILSVGQLTRSIKTHLEKGFPFVWVRGEVSNCSRPSSGHLYFCLKDRDAVLNAVWFKNQQRATEAFDPLTGEVFEDGPRQSLAPVLANGQEVICAGCLTVYGARGQYQLAVEILQDAGQGALQREFERAKAALQAKGYFHPDRKRPLPANPARVAVITAVTGAAVRDFIRIAAERGTGGELRVYPTPVQGAEAPERIAQALRRAAGEGWAEVAVVIRGGGSLEDLWAFNTEVVAEAVFTCPLPVLAGIGHEVDVSIADLVADVRAATPTHAAQMLWPEKRELAQRLDDWETRLTTAWDRYLGQRLERLDTANKALSWLSPERAVGRWAERLASLDPRLVRAAQAVVQRKEARAEVLDSQLDRTMAARLDALGRCLDSAAVRLAGADPLLPLQRGYALVRKPDGAFVRSVTDAAFGDHLNLVLADGELTVQVDQHPGLTGSDHAR